MESGTIGKWKVKEGDKFSAGDVLLSVETDKAEMEVEAQDDGVMGKIIVGDGEANVPVGKLIAILAEEGDDLSSLTIPSESDPSSSKSPESAKSTEPAQSSKQAKSSKPSTESESAPSSKSHSHPTHSKPLLPSVLFLLEQNRVSNAPQIKGSGRGGMLIKGDVLAHLGRIKDPRGSLVGKQDIQILLEQHERTKSCTSKHVESAPLDELTLRRLFVSGLTQLSVTKSLPTTPQISSVSTPQPNFDDILKGYLPPTSPVPLLEHSLSKAPRLTTGLSRDDPLRMVLEV